MLVVLFALFVVAVTAVAAAAFFRTREAAARQEVDRLETEVRGLRRVATGDPLTGLGTHERLIENGVRLIAKHERWGSLFSLALIEVALPGKRAPELKPPVIARIAETLREAARTEDYIYRISPQTFAALLIECDLAGARQCADRVRNALGKLDIPAGSGSTSLSIICGVAQWKKELGTMDHLLGAADEDAGVFEESLERERASFGVAYRRFLKAYPLPRSRFLPMTKRRRTGTVTSGRASRAWGVRLRTWTVRLPRLRSHII